MNKDEQYFYECVWNWLAILGLIVLYLTPVAVIIFKTIKVLGLV